MNPDWSSWQRWRCLCPLHCLHYTTNKGINRSFCPLLAAAALVREKIKWSRCFLASSSNNTTVETGVGDDLSVSVFKWFKRALPLWALLCLDYFLTTKLRRSALRRKLLPAVDESPEQGKDETSVAVVWNRNTVSERRNVFLVLGRSVAELTGFLQVRLNIISLDFCFSSHCDPSFTSLFSGHLLNCASCVCVFSSGPSVASVTMTTAEKIQPINNQQNDSI